MKKFFTLLMATLSFGVAFGQNCSPNTHSLQFNGFSDEVALPRRNAYEITDAITVSAWINATQWASGSALGSIFCKHGWSSGERGFVLRCGANGVLSFTLAGVNTSGINVSWVEANSLGFTPMNANQWYHAAGVFDGDSVKVYIDGVLAGYTLFQGSIDTSSGYRPTIGNLADSVQFQNRYFTGLIDEVKLFNRALTAAEIMAGMNVQVDAATQNGLVGYWRMNEGGGSTLLDYSTQQGNGNLLAPVYSTTVPFNVQIPQATIYPPADTVVCSADNYQLYGTTGTGNTYVWNTGSTNAILPITMSGDYFVTITNASGCSATSDTVNVTVNASPLFPVITMNGQGQLVCNVINQVQWFLDGNNTGQTTPVITPTQNGVYTVVVTGVAGCTLTSVPYNLTNLGLSDQGRETLFSIRPNVSEGLFYLDFVGSASNPMLFVRDISGKELLRLERMNADSVLDLSSFEKGIYFVELMSEGRRDCKKIVVQ
jgi:hypothetical protein